MALAQKFYSLFRGLDRAHGELTITGKNETKNKVTGAHVTIRSGATPELWERHLTGKTSIGVPPLMDDGTVLFGAIDIDVPGIDHVALERRILELKLPLIVCKSKSNGAHCYLFCTDPTPAELVRSTLLEWSLHIGHPGVEVFPKQVALANKTDDVGNWINMPYFGDSRVAVIAGKEVTAETFMLVASKTAVTEEQLRTVTQPPHKFEGMPPCLESLCNTGFPEGVRNQGLFNAAVYFRMACPDSWENELYTFNNDYMSPPCMPPEVIEVTKSVKRKQTYFYTCDQPPIVGVCNKELCRKRKFGIGNAESTELPMIDQLIRRGDDPPTWFVHVDGKRVQLTTDMLMKYSLFQKAVMEQATKAIPTIKPSQWYKIYSNLVENVVKEDAPIDASVTGQLMSHLEAFLTRRKHAATRDGLLNGGVFVDEDQVAHFRSQDLMEYLANHRFSHYKVTEVYSALRDSGAGTDAFNIKGAYVRVWTMPLVNQQTEDFDVPDIERGDYRV